MEIALAEQHVYLLDERLAVDEIRQRAMDRRSKSKMDQGNKPSA